jgi:hypothetical protein
MDLNVPIAGDVLIRVRRPRHDSHHGRAPFKVFLTMVIYFIHLCNL